MLLEKAFQDFIEFHEIDNQSRYAIRNYREGVGSFIEWLSGEHSITDTDDLKVTHFARLARSPAKDAGQTRRGVKG